MALQLSQTQGLHQIAEKSPADAHTTSAAGLRPIARICPCGIHCRHLARPALWSDWAAGYVCCDRGARQSPYNCESACDIRRSVPPASRTCENGAAEYRTSLPDGIAGT